MCECSDNAKAVPAGGVLSRRSMLRAGGVSASAGLLLAGCATGRQAGDSSTGPAAQVQGYRTRVVLLGTAGGPTIVDRAGTSTAVVYDDRVYIVDLGFASPGRLVQSGLGGQEFGSAFSKVCGIFFTHMHSDHLTEWPAVYNTIPNNTRFTAPAQPIMVFGPGDRGAMPRVFPEGRNTPEVVNPDNPTMGIANMTEQLRKAFASDLNDRFRDSNYPDPRDTFQIHDIDVSPYWKVDPSGIPPELPRGTRIPVWQDGDVTITATLVDHRPTAPAFGFRFDTPDGSVVLSGDTNPNKNLIDLATGADVLVHEVIDANWVHELAAKLPKDQQGPMREHLLASHTTIEQVGRDVGEVAGVRNLVLTHLGPADNPVDRWQQAQQGFSGKLIVGEDLLQVGVGRSR